MCICVPVYAYMYIYRYRYITCMSRNPLRSEDGVRSPETGTTDDCEQACECWEVELSFLQDPTPMLISTEPSLKPSTSNFKCEIPASVGEYLQNTKICKLPLNNTQHMTHYKCLRGSGESVEREEEFHSPETAVLTLRITSSTWLCVTWHL